MNLCDSSEVNGNRDRESKETLRADRILVAQITWINECIEQGTVICALLRAETVKRRSGGVERFYLVLGRESGMMTNPDVAKKGSKLEGAAAFLNTRTLLPDEPRKAAARTFLAQILEILASLARFCRSLHGRDWPRAAP